MSRRSLAAALAAVALAATLALTGAQAASAHDVLESTTPSADQTVDSAITAVTLTFSEPPLAGVPSAIQVTDAAGARVDSGPVTASDRSLSVAITPTVVGVYQVVWQTVSSDSHTISNRFSFTYAGPVPSPSPEPSSASASPSASPATGAPNASAPPAVAASSDGPIVPLIIGVLAVVLVALLVVVLRASRTRRTRP